MAFVFGVAAAQFDALPKRYQTIVDQNNIALRDLKPWHLKASYQRFNLTGKVIEQGTTEEWWLSPSSWHLTVDTGGRVTDFVHVDGKTYSPSADDAPPISLQILLPELVEPASLDMFLNSTPTLGTRKVQALSMDCVALTRQGNPVYAHRSMAYRTELCFDQNNSLRLTVRDDFFAFNRNKIGKFQGRDVAASIDATDRRGKVFSAQVLELTSIPEVASI